MTRVSTFRGVDLGSVATWFRPLSENEEREIAITDYWNRLNRALEENQPFPEGLSNKSMWAISVLAVAAERLKARHDHNCRQVDMHYEKRGAIAEILGLHDEGECEHLDCCTD